MGSGGQLILEGLYPPEGDVAVAKPAREKTAILENETIAILINEEKEKNSTFWTGIIASYILPTWV